MRGSARQRLRTARPGAVLVVLLCLVGLACDGPGVAAPPRLAILISIDTLRPDHLGLYGYEKPTSPKLDEFAESAVVFEDAQSTAPWTLPAHGSLLTGRYPSRLGLDSTATLLPPEIPTLAELLRDAGWRTAGFVNSRFVSARHGFDRGFDHFEYLPETYHQIGASAVLLERASALIEEPRDTPLFVFLHLYDAHSDYRARHIYQRDLVEAYEGPASGLTPQLLAVRQGRLAFDDDDLEHVIGLYDAQIREIDSYLGRFFERLRGAGLFESAFIAVVSDHGDEFLEHGGLLHGRSHHREIIRVPLVVRDGAWPKGKRVATPVSTLDVAPTLLRAVSVAVPEGLKGRDLTPLHSAATPDGNTSDTSQRIFYSEAALETAPDEAFEPHQGSANPGSTRAARRGRYSLHLDEASGAYRMYDLVADPTESIDIAAQEPEQAARLLAALERFAAGARSHSEFRSVSPREREQLRRLGYLIPPVDPAAAPPDESR